MKLKKYISGSILLCLVFLFNISSFSQESFVRVRGNVLNLNKLPIKGATVNVFLENNKVKSVISNKKGEFNIELQHSKNYIVEASKGGFVTKKIKFSTKVPQKDVKGYMWEYELNFQIFEMLDGLDVSILKDPVAAIQYSSADEDFDFDDKYTSEMNKKIEGVIKQYETLKKKQYEKELNIAENLFNKEKYEESWLAYNKAQELEPKEKAPKKKVNEIKKILMKNATEATAYRTAINKADNLFNTKRLDDAMKAYEVAMLYKPEDKYSNDKISEVNKLLAQGVPGTPVESDLTASTTTTTTTTTVTSAPEIKIEEVSTDKILRDNALKESKIKQKIDSCKNILAAREKAGDKKGAVVMINRIAEFYLSMGDFDSANEYYDKALRINQELGDKVAISKTLNNLGVVSDNAASPDKALAYFQHSLDVKKDLKDDEGMAKVYYRMAKVYQKKRDLARALEYYEKSRAIDEKFKKDKEVAISNLIIGNVYFEMKKFDNAAEYYNKANDAFERLAMKKESAIALNNSGNVFYEQRDNDKALDFYNRSINEKEKISFKAGVALSLHNVGNIYKAKNELDKAIGFYNKSMLRAKVANDNVVIARNYFTFNEVFSAQSNHQKALEYFKLYTSISQIVQGADVPGQIVENLIKYEGDAITKDSEMSILKSELIKQKLYSQAIALKNEAQNAEMARMDAQMKQQRIMQFAFIGGFLIVAVFSVFLLLNYRKLKKAYIIITAHEKVIEAQKQEIETQRDFVMKQGDRIALQNVKIKNQRDIATLQAKEINDSINYARYIQSALLAPDDEVMSALTEHFVMFKPKKVVSGDFYWIKNVKFTDNEKQRNLFLIVVADCTGPGVPGAVMSMLGVSLLNEILNKIVETQSYSNLQSNIIMNQLRDKFIKSLHLKGKEGETKDGMDVSICILDAGDKTLQYSGANHPLFIVRKPSVMNPLFVMEEVKADKIPIGMYTEIDKTFSRTNIQLAKGDAFYMFTDGYYDQFGGQKGKKFMLKHFKELIMSNQGKTMDEQKIVFNHAFEEWKGDQEQVDDVLIVGLKV
ncbi:MAG: tetratricopeptide repeat protein [Bacteroidetes bacterium]|nr:tetratricopeptide repeat protein [Bacteroidota bacterium]